MHSFIDAFLRGDDSAAYVLLDWLEERNELALGRAHIVQLRDAGYYPPGGIRTLEKLYWLVNNRAFEVEGEAVSL